LKVHKTGDDMPVNPTLESVAPNGVVKLDGGPGGYDTDAAFDALFPADGAVSTTAAPQVTPTETTQPTTTPAPAQSVTPTVVPSESDFLKGSKSVYKTREAAIEGINHKDATIDTLRQRFVLATGVDPLTNQPAQPLVQQQVEVDYSKDSKKYLEDLYQASQKSPEAYGYVQQKFIKDSLGTVLPAMQNVVLSSQRNEAVSSVSKEIADFKTFYGSESYSKALDTVPELKNAIAAGESSTEFAGQLPGLYRAAYLIGKGLQVPQIVAAAATTPANSAPVRTVTPTVTPRTATLPSATTVAAGTNFRNINSIRATIADLEAKGVSLDF
jgi:hypothetical protein